MMTNSPPFRVLHTAAIPVGGSVMIRAAGFESGATDAKYAPFNRLFVQNFDSQPLDIEYGLGRRIRVPGGLSMTIEQPGIDQIRVINAGAGATSEPIEIVYQLKPTVEDLLHAILTGAPLAQVMRR